MKCLVDLTWRIAKFVLRTLRILCMYNIVTLLCCMVLHKDCPNSTQHYKCFTVNKVLQLQIFGVLQVFSKTQEISNSQLWHF